MECTCNVSTPMPPGNLSAPDSPVRTVCSICDNVTALPSIEYPIKPVPPPEDCYKKIFVSVENRSCVSKDVKLFDFTSLLNGDYSDEIVNITGFNGFSYVNDLVALADGKMLVIGYLISYNGVVINKSILRLNANRTIDSTFNSGIGFTADIAFRIAIQPDGKIIAIGEFDSYNGTPANRIIRLNSDGTIDASFNIGTGFNNSAFGINIQPDGKIIIVGTFTSYNGTAASRIIRLNSDGTIDASFNIGTGIDSPSALIGVIAVQPDGKIIIVGGFFDSYNGTPTATGIIRLNSDGTLDNAFNLVAGAGLNDSGASDVLLQQDGKIIISGYFNTYNNSPVTYGLIRLNSDGTLDNTFNPGGLGFNAGSDINCILFQGSRILVGGYFSSYNGVPLSAIIRLNSDGTLDNTFDSGVNPDAYITRIAMNTCDNTIIPVGYFNTFHGNSIDNIVWLSQNDGSFKNVIQSAIFFNADYSQMVSGLRQNPIRLCSIDMMSSSQSQLINPLIISCRDMDGNECENTEFPLISISKDQFQDNKIVHHFMTTDSIVLNGLNCIVKYRVLPKQSINFVLCVCDEVKVSDLLKTELLKIWRLPTALAETQPQNDVIEGLPKPNNNPYFCEDICHTEPGCTMPNSYNKRPEYIKPKTTRVESNSDIRVVPLPSIERPVSELKKVSLRPTRLDNEIIVKPLPRDGNKKLSYGKPTSVGDEYDINVRKPIIPEHDIRFSLKYLFVKPKRIL
jgi:uncharacterized delta-60 repeat protein